MNNIAKIGKELLDIWDVTDLTDIMFKDGYGTLPIPTPWALASGLLTEFEIIMQNLRDALHRDFEIIKQNGLEKCISFVKSSSGRIGKYFYKKISTYSLKRLLKGELLNVSDFEKNDFGDTIHTVFYRQFRDDNRKDSIHIIDCIFINDSLLNNNNV